MRSPLRLARLLSFFICSAAAGLGEVAAPAADPVEGSWFGELEYAGDRCGVGFAIKRDDSGQLVAFYTKTALSVYGQPVGALVADGPRYTLTAAKLVLTLLDDRLECRLTPLQLPLVMHRVAALPVAPAPVAHAPGPAPLWQAQLAAPIYAAPAVRDGFAYIGTTGGIFNCVDLRDGACKWVFGAGRPIHGEALVTAEHVYFVCDNGRLYKLARADGKEVWHYELGDAQIPRLLLHPQLLDNDHGAPQPIIADGVIYVGSGDGSFHALSADTGTRLWRFTGDGTKIRQTALVDGERVIFGNLGGKIFALSRTDGAELWHYDTAGAVTSAPTIMGDKLLVGSRSSRFSAVSVRTGQEIWKKYFWGSWVESSPVIEGGLCYVGSSDLHETRCYDPADGRLVWSAPMSSWCWSRPAVTGKTVYVCTGGSNFSIARLRGGLTAIDRATGAVRWHRPAGADGAALLSGFAAAPVVAGKILLAAGLDGVLYAFPAE